MNEQSFSPEPKEEVQADKFNDLVEQKCFEGMKEQTSQIIQDIEQKRLSNHWLRYNNALLSLFHSRSKGRRSDSSYYINFFAKKFQPGFPNRTDPKEKNWTYFEESLVVAFLADYIPEEQKQNYQNLLANELGSSTISRILAAVAVSLNLGLEDLAERSHSRFQEYQKWLFEGLDNLDFNIWDHNIRGFLILVSLVDLDPEILPKIVRSVDDIVDQILSSNLNEAYQERLTLLAEALISLSEKSDQVADKIKTALPRFYQLSQSGNLACQMPALMIINHFSQGEVSERPISNYPNLSNDEMETINQKLTKLQPDGLLAYFQTLADLARVQKKILPLGQIMGEKLVEFIQSIAPSKYQIFYQQEIIFKLIDCINQVGDLAAIPNLKIAKSMLGKEYKEQISQVIGSLDQTPASNLSFTDPSRSEELATKSSLSFGDKANPANQSHQVAQLRPISSQEKYQENPAQNRLTGENPDQLEEEIRSRQNA